jgi:hypothetical protein
MLGQKWPPFAWSVLTDIVTHDIQDIVACLVSATVNNCAHRLWSVNLLDFNSYNNSYSLHIFKSHKPETCSLVRYHFTYYLIVRGLAVSLLLTASVLTVPICVCISF